MASPQSPAERQKKRIKDLDDKWKMLFNERPRPPLYSVDKYVEYLRKFTTSPSVDDSLNSKGSTRSNSSTGSNAGQQVSYLLKKLKLDLKMSYERFLETFISEPNNGLILLLSLLKNIQKTSRDDQKGTVREKMQSKKRLMSEELECIMCIKFCLRYEESAKILLAVSYGLENIAEVLLSSNIRSRCTALEVMSKVLTEDEGFHRNLECFTYFRLKNSEPVRFKFLINMLMTAGSSSVQVSFQLCCMKFINSLLTSCPDGNTRIFLQSEVEMAGLEVKTLLKSVQLKTAPEKDELKQEIIDFKNSLLDVDQLLESHETLYKLNVELHRKVAELQEKLQNLKLERTTNVDDTENENFDDMMEQETIPDLEALDELLDSIDSESDVSIINSKPMPISPKLKRRGSNRNWRKTGIEHPVMKNDSLSATLNQSPCHHSNHSDDQKNQSYSSQNSNTNRLQNIDKNLSLLNKIQFIERSKAEKLLTVKKLIGLPSAEIVACLHNCDVKQIDTGILVMLMGLLPGENEMQNIVSLDCELSNLDEAEQFLIQIMSVERLEDKLKLMVFVLQFQTLIGGMCEGVSQIKESSRSLIMCNNFRELLEIIKTYMVDNYYATPLDFRLSTLGMLETTYLSVTSQSLLEFFVDLVSTRYQHLLNWYKDVAISIHNKVSLQRISAFVRETKVGLNAMEIEQRQCPTDNLTQLHVSVRHNFNDFYQNFLEMECVYRDVCKVFMENNKDIEPLTFFGYVTEFLESFKEIAEKIESKEAFPVQILEPEPDYMSEAPIENETSRSKNNEICKNQENSENDKRSEELTASDLETFGLTVTSSIDERQRIQNWIVTTTPTPSLNIEVINNKCNKPWHKSTYTDSDSEDSAFEGSGGRGLKTYVEKSNNDCEQMRTSTPVTVSTAVDEPPPDYSRSTSPDIPDKQMDDISSEVSRILRDFEGDLNGYETNLTSPVNRRFYTVHSIIHL